MSFNVKTLSVFERQARRLIRKYPSLKTELAELGGQLTENPAMGTPLGQDCYKIRLAIASKGKGKSGGARIITPAPLDLHHYYPKRLVGFCKPRLSNIGFLIQTYYPNIILFIN